MGYNRPGAKALAKQAMRTTYPHPMLVTLVYVLLTSVLTSLVSGLVTDPFSTFYWYVIDGAYEIEDLVRVLLTPQTVAAYGLVQLLITVYQWVMSFGYTSYALRMARNEQPDCRSLLDGFLTLGRALLVYLMIAVFTSLWGLLAMVPGFVLMFMGVWLNSALLSSLSVFLMMAGVIWMVIVSLRYRLAVYFLVDNPDMGAIAAITESKRAMVGWKGELFLQDLTFLGWYMLMILVSAVAGGVGSIFGVLGMGIMSTLGSAALALWLTPYVWGTEANFYDWVVHGRYSYPEQSGGPGGGYQSPYGNF